MQRQEDRSTRDQQDAFALASQQKASAAQKGGRFKDEIAPVTIKGRKGDTIVDQDEFIREGVVVASLAGLRPAFNKDGIIYYEKRNGVILPTKSVFLDAQKLPAESKLSRRENCSTGISDGEYLSA